MKNHNVLALVVVLATTMLSAQNSEDKKSFVKSNNVVEHLAANKSPTNEESTKKELVKKESDLKEKQIFLEKAKKAALTENTITELLKLFEKRNHDLEELNQQSKHINSSYSFLDQKAEIQRKIANVKTNFSKSIVLVLNYKQFGDFIIDDYKDEALDNTRVEFLKLLHDNSDLTKEQKAKLFTLIGRYNIHVIITKKYYTYDKTLEKQRLAILKLSFEKEYAKLAKELNINADNTKTVNNNTFQWD